MQDITTEFWQLLYATISAVSLKCNKNIFYNTAFALSLEEPQGDFSAFSSAAIRNAILCVKRYAELEIEHGQVEILF